MEQYKISIACIIEYNEKFLMVKEEQNGRVSWDIPAGGIELGETLDQAIIREVEEETGLQINDFEIKTVILYREKQRTTANFLYYKKLYSLENASMGAHDSDIVEVKWFSKSEVQEMVKEGKYEHEMAKRRLSFIMEGFQQPLSVVQI